MELLDVILPGEMILAMLQKVETEKLVERMGQLEIATAHLYFQRLYLKQEYPSDWTLRRC